MKVITNDNRIEDNFALLLELNDLELAMVENDFCNICSIDNMQRFMKSKGNHAHIVRITIHDEANIRKGVETLLKCYDSVSWYNPDHKFHIRRSECLSYQQH